VSLFGSGRREGVLAVVVLLLLSALLHAPTLLGGRERDSADPTLGATAEAATTRTTLLPAMHAAGRVLEHGELPLWNPHARLGEPFPVSGAVLLYPPFWLLLLVPVQRWLAVVLLLHTFLACMFMYRFLRTLPVSRYVAFLGGGSYGMGWYLTASLDRLPEAAAAALLPLALEMTWRITVSRQRAFFLSLAGLSIALLFWTGGVSTATLGCLLCAAIVLAEWLVLDDTDRGRALKTLAGAAAIALLLTAPLWLGALQHANGMAAASAPPTAALQPAGLFGLLAPGLFGDLRGTSCEVLAAVNPGADPLELALYPGALVLFMFVLGLLRPKHTYLGVLWLLVAGAGILLAIDGPVHDAVARLLPARLLQPGAALVLLQIGLIAWTALALENFFDAPLRRAFATPLTAVVGMLAAGGLVALVLSGQILGILERHTGIAFAPELEVAAKALLRAIAPTAVTLTAVSVLFLCWRRLGVLRFKPLLALAVFAEIVFHGLLAVPHRAPQPQPPILAAIPAGAGRVAAVGRSPLPVLADLQAEGRSVLTTSGDAILRRTARLVGLVDPAAVRVGARARVGPLARAALAADPLLATARVDALVAGRPLRAPGFQPLASAPAGEGAPPRLHVATRDAAPTLRFAWQVLAADSEHTAARLLRSPERDARSSVVLEGADPTFRCQAPAAAPHVTVLDDSANRLALRVDMHEGRGYLVVHDAWAPGWTARLDGARTPLLPADLAFRAIAVPEGEHDIELRYAPWSAVVGLPVLGFGLVLVLALVLLGVLRGCWRG
jgi:hypothetical protein